MQSVDEAVRERLAAFQARHAHNAAHLIGFPAATDNQFASLAPLMVSLLNNAGDPYEDSFFAGHSKEFEREVLDFFAELFRAPAGDYWGYVASGSTECILFALWLAREKYPTARVFYSDAAHFCVRKNAHLLGLPVQVVRTHARGEMDYGDLQAQVAKYPGCPAIVVATVGTTMSEAKDNVAEIKAVLDATGSEYYIHADAALAGVYIPLLQPDFPFDFSAGADSLNISGHKFMGAPMPCGVILVRRANLDYLEIANNYTGSADSTISGSRNGHALLFLWYTIQHWGRAGLKRRAQESLQTAVCTVERLHQIGWPAWRHEGALTVMLAAPPTKLIRKWQLATADGWSHAVCMPGVPEARIDAFVADLDACERPQVPH